MMDTNEQVGRRMLVKKLTAESAPHHLDADVDALAERARGTLREAQKTWPSIHDLRGAEAAVDALVAEVKRLASAEARYLDALEQDDPVAWINEMCGAAEEQRDAARFIRAGWRRLAKQQAATCDAEMAGRHAESDGLWQDDNPHPNGSDLHRAWDHGWLRAHERTVGLTAAQQVRDLTALLNRVSAGLGLDLAALADAGELETSLELIRQAKDAVEKSHAVEAVEALRAWGKAREKWRASLDGDDDDGEEAADAAHCDATVELYDAERSARGLADRLAKEPR